MSGGISIAIKTSFEVHTKEEQESIYLLYAEAHHAQDALLRLNTKKLAKQRAALLALHTFYKEELGTTNPASFGFLTPEQKIRLKNKLIYTYYLLYAQYQLDSTEKRRYTLKDHGDALALCVQRIKELDTTGVCGQATPFEDDLEANIALATQCLKFIGLTQIASWFVEKFEQFMDNHTGTLVKWMTEVNNSRLYWVWGGGMLDTIFTMLPDDFYNKLEAQANLTAPSPITGYMSWVLYYTRFGINLFLLWKHTFHPSKEECHIPRWERFLTQWNQRKFALLNDSIWGVANMVCFFWLKGGGMLGYAGNVVTVALLLMDLALATWRFCEEATKHNTKMEAIKRDKEKLASEIASMAFALENELNVFKKQELAAKLARMENELTTLNKMETKANFEWKYKKYGLMNDWAYALGLMVAFSIMCCFFFPPAAIVPATAMIIGVVGAALCFVLTVATAAVTGALEVAKSRESSKLERETCERLLGAFKKETDPNLKKQLYLDMKLALAESDYQQRAAQFQMAKLVRSVLIDALIPPLVFVSLIFMPIGIGLAVLAAGFALAVITNAIINRFEPKHEKLPYFNEADYAAFASNPDLKQLENTAAKEAKKGRNLFGLMKPSEDYTKLAEEPSNADLAVINTHDLGFC